MPETTADDRRAVENLIRAVAQALMSGAKREQIVQMLAGRAMSEDDAVGFVNAIEQEMQKHPGLARRGDSGCGP
jgi:hypothetical protein